MKFSRSVIIGQVLAFVCAAFGIWRAFFTRQLGPEMTGYQIAFWRVAIGGILLALVLRKKTWPRPERCDWLWLFASAALLPMLMCCYVYAVMHLSIALALFLSFMSPLWMTGFIWLRRKVISRLVLLSLVLYLLGESSLLFNEQNLSKIDLAGVAAALLGGLGQAAFMWVNRELTQRTKLPSYALATYQQILSALLLLALAWPLHLGLQLPSRLIPLGELFLLAAIAGTIFFWLSFEAQRRISALEFSMWATLDPLLASLFVGQLWYHEGSLRLTLAGASLVTIGALLSVFAQQRQNVS